METKTQILKALAKVTGVKPEQIHLETPENEEFGDYSSNIALQIKGKNPREVSNRIVQKLKKDNKLQTLVSNIEVAGPGFINFWLKSTVLLTELNEVVEKKDEYGKSETKKGKKVLLEHTSPNPQTTIMLGHLRNNFLGMSIANLLEFQGAEVVRDAIVNDRGIHISRSMYGYLVFAGKETGLTKEELVGFKDVPDERLEEISRNALWRELLIQWSGKNALWYVPDELSLKPDHANLIWYVLGSKAFKLFDNVKGQVKEILMEWEKENKDVWELWRKILDWSNKGYEETYKRVGSKHDWVWHESELYKGGKELVEKGLEDGVFQKSEGAIVTNLKKSNLSDMVVIKSDGTSTYVVFDLNLTVQKQRKFPSDLYLWTIGQEQTLYFKQLFAVCEQLGLGEKENFYHLSYALINFKGSRKMSTREGSVVMADEILDKLEEKALEIIKSSNQELRAKLTDRETEELVKTIALGAIKYSLLRVARETTIFYDMKGSISLEGNSGPYLQYTYARTQSVLRKAQAMPFKDTVFKGINQNKEESALLRSFIHFSEVIASAAKNYSPNLLCNYLYDLASKFNLFYARHRILDINTERLENVSL